MSQALFELLHRCTVKIGVPDGSWGTGFFVAPGWVMTCAHVVNDALPESIQVMGNGAITHAVNTIHFPPQQEMDVVVLEVVRVGAGAVEGTDDQPCVRLDETSATDSALYIYGFPTDFPGGAPTPGGLCDGAVTDDRGPLIKFRGMQIQPGHSGAALLNRETGAVCGVVNKTRGEQTDLGGVAVPVAEIWHQFPEVRQRNQAFHQKDRRWARVMDERVQVRAQRFNLPPAYKQNVYFTGREAVLQKLHEQLQSGNAAINQAQGISGLGGIGKTQTAVEYAYRYFEVSYGWVFWVRADTLLNLQTDLGAVATQVGLVSDATVELDQQIQMALGWLNTHGEWLLVVDNADDSKVLAQLFQYLPTNKTGRILITSRQSQLDMVHVPDPVSLGPWDRAASVDFLLKRTQRSDTEPDRTEAGALAEALGNLPLALEQAAAFIVRRKLAFRVYLQQYEKRRLELLERETAKTGNYPHTVWTTWQLNFEAVAEANPASVELLRLSALLATDEIPYELLIRGRQHWGEELRSALESEDWNTALFLTGDVLEPLSQYSLIQWESKAERYNIHRMVQEVVKSQMDEVTQLDWANRGLEGIAHAFPDSNEIENWPVCELLLPHGLQLRLWLTRERIWSETGGRLLHTLGYYLEKRGQYSLASAIVEQSLEMRKEILGNRHPDVATSLNNLALLYESQGRYAEAESYFQQALDMRKELLGDRHPNVATSWDNLALLYKSKGRYVEAETYVQQALEMRKELLGDRHPDVASSLNNLALLYELQGRYVEAEPYFLQSLEMKRELLGDRHPDVATSWDNLAGVYESQERYAEAEPYFQQALDMRKELLGDRHPNVATSLNNLANLYDSQGRYAEAEPYYQQSLEMMRELLGDRHPDVATSLNNLAGVYMSQGRYAEAEPYFLQSLEMMRELLGDRHPNVAASLNNLATLYKSQGRYEEAEAYFLQTLSIWVPQLGQNHPNVITTVNNLFGLVQTVMDAGQEAMLSEHPMIEAMVERVKTVEGDV